MEDLAKRIANMEAELLHLREKTNADERMIALLKNQNETQAMEIVKMTHDHANELRHANQRRDLAVRKEMEIDSILNTAAKGIIEGLRRMRGEETAPYIPQADDAPITPPTPQIAKIEDMRGTGSSSAGVLELMRKLPPNKLSTG